MFESDHRHRALEFWSLVGQAGQDLNMAGFLYDILTLTLFTFEKISVITQSSRKISTTKYQTLPYTMLFSREFITFLALASVGAVSAAPAPAPAPEAKAEALPADYGSYGN